MGANVVQKALSDLSIANLKTEGYFWDRLPGFGIRVGKHRKTFIVVRRGRRTTLGVYPHLSLADARRLASDSLYSTNSGKKTTTCEKALETYLAQLQLKERTIEDFTRLLNIHMLPAIGGKQLGKITAQDILAITDDLLDRPSECRHAHAAIQTFFGWCVPRFISQSPMHGLKCPTSANHRTRVLADAELKTVWKAAQQLDNYGIVVQLCILLATRKCEPTGKLTLAETTVTFHDTKNGQDHTLPITPYMHALLSKVRYTNGWSKNKARLDALAKVTGFTHHDLRRTTATNLSRLGTDPFLIERILNHSMPKLQNIYNRHDFTEAMREPLKKHQEWLFQLMAT